MDLQQFLSAIWISSIDPLPPPMYSGWIEEQRRAWGGNEIEARLQQGESFLMQEDKTDSYGKGIFRWDSIPSNDL